MKAKIITAKHLEAFADNLLQKITTLMDRKPPTPPQRKWLKSHEVRGLLSVSAGTLQTLRLNGTLPFTKIGSIFFYNYEDIEQLIEQRKVNTGRSVRTQRKRGLAKHSRQSNKTKAAL